MNGGGEWPRGGVKAALMTCPCIQGVNPELLPNDLTPPAYGLQLNFHLAFSIRSGLAVCSQGFLSGVAVMTKRLA